MIAWQTMAAAILNFCDHSRNGLVTATEFECLRVDWRSGRTLSCRVMPVTRGWAGGLQLFWEWMTYDTKGHWAEFTKLSDGGTLNSEARPTAHP